MKMNQNVVLVGNLGSLLTVFKSFIIKGRVIVFDNFDINVKRCLEKAEGEKKTPRFQVWTRCLA